MPITKFNWVYVVRHIKKRCSTYYNKKILEDKKKLKNGFSTYYSKKKIRGQKQIICNLDINYSLDNAYVE